MEDTSNSDNDRKSCKTFVQRLREIAADMLIKSDNDEGTATAQAAAVATSYGVGSDDAMHRCGGDDGTKPQRHRNGAEVRVPPPVLGGCGQMDGHRTCGQAACGRSLRPRSGSEYESGCE